VPDDPLPQFSQLEEGPDGSACLSFYFAKDGVWYRSVERGKIVRGKFIGEGAVVERHSIQKKR